MGKRLVLYAPPRMGRLILPILLPLWLWITYEAFFDPAAQEETPPAAWAVISGVFGGIYLLVRAMSSRRIHVYIIQEGKVLAPRWLRHLVLGLLLPVAALITYAAFFTQDGRREMGLLGWGAIMLTCLGVVRMVWVLTSGEGPSYIVEEEEWPPPPGPARAAPGSGGGAPGASGTS